LEIKQLSEENAIKGIDIVDKEIKQKIEVRICENKIETMTRNNFSYDDITRKVKQKVLIS
jgi:hypothetical protein